MVSHPTPLRAQARPRLLIVVATLVLSALTSAESCLDDTPPPVCQANCDIEAECEFRTLEACQAASCNPLTGEVLHTNLDACPTDCDTLVDQLPTQTYLENVCRIESSCEDQAVCSSVSG